MAGVAVEKLGLRAVIAADPVDQHLGRLGLADFWQRHLRWGRIRKSQAPVAFLLEPLTGCMVSGILGAWATHAILGAAMSGFMIGHIVVWSACDGLMIRRLSGKPHP